MGLLRRRNIFKTQSIKLFVGTVGLADRICPFPFYKLTISSSYSPVLEPNSLTVIISSKFGKNLSVVWGFLWI